MLVNPWLRAKKPRLHFPCNFDIWMSLENKLKIFTRYTTNFHSFHKQRRNSKTRNYITSNTQTSRLNGLCIRKSFQTSIIRAKRNANFFLKKNVIK